MYSLLPVVIIELNGSDSLPVVTGIIKVYQAAAFIFSTIIASKYWDNKSFYGSDAILYNAPESSAVFIWITSHDMMLQLQLNVMYSTCDTVTVVLIVA